MGPAWTYPCALLTFYSSVTIAGITASDLNPLKSELITLLVRFKPSGTRIAWLRPVSTGLPYKAARVALYEHCKVLIADRESALARRCAAR